jgi:signal transduction histidine kinase
MLILGILAVSLAAAAAITDWATWIELNLSILYGLPLILAAAARNRRLLWGLMSILVIVTFTVYSVQIPRGRFSLVEPFFVDRALSTAAMLLTAWLGHIWIRTTETLDAQGRALKEQNEELGAANRELVRREELIARQNEELERRRHEAEESSSRKSRLLASVSHDIRTPLYTINFLAEAIRRAGGSPAAAAAQIPEMAQRLQADARWMAELVSDLLDMARIDAGRLDLKESTFSLNDLLTGQCRDAALLAEAKALRLEAQLPEPPLWLRADRGKLSRVLSNLVVNAIKFTETGGITVSGARSPDGEALITVRDTGCGIAPEQLDRVFEEFTQVHKTGGERNKGWGLGLAISRRLVNAQGGSITVESAPGLGSVFSVRLPSACIVEAPDRLSQPCACAKVNGGQVEPAATADQPREDGLLR